MLDAESLDAAREARVTGPFTLEGQRLTRLSALHPMDFRPRSEEARVRRLLPK